MSKRGAASPVTANWLASTSCVRLSLTNARLRRSLVTRFAKKRGCNKSMKTMSRQAKCKCRNASNCPSRTEKQTNSKVFQHLMFLYLSVRAYDMKSRPRKLHYPTSFLTLPAVTLGRYHQQSSRTVVPTRTSVSSSSTPLIACCV